MRDIQRGKLSYLVLDFSLENVKHLCFEKEEKTLWRILKNMKIKKMGNFKVS